MSQNGKYQEHTFVCNLFISPGENEEVREVCMYVCTGSM